MVDTYAHVALVSECGAGRPGRPEGVCDPNPLQILRLLPDVHEIRDHAGNANAQPIVQGVHRPGPDAQLPTQVLPFADSRPDAAEGYTAQTRTYRLEVRCPEALRASLAPEQWEALAGVLAGDPRPSYQDDPARVYGMRFAGYEVRFTVAEGVLTVCGIAPEG